MDSLRGKTPSDLRRDVRSVLYSGAMPVERRRVLGCVTEKRRAADVEPDDVLGDETTTTTMTTKKPRPAPAAPEVCDAGALVFTYFLDPKAETSVLEAWERSLVDAVAFIKSGDDGGAHNGFVDNHNNSGGVVGGDDDGGDVQQDSRGVEKTADETDATADAETIAADALRAAARAVAAAGLVVEANAEISTTLEVEAQERADFGLLVGSYAMMAFVVSLLLSPSAPSSSYVPSSLCCRNLISLVFTRLLLGVAGVALVALGGVDVHTAYHSLP